MFFLKEYEGQDIIMALRDFFSKMNEGIMKKGTNNKE